MSPVVVCEARIFSPIEWTCLVTFLCLGYLLHILFAASDSFTVGKRSVVQISSHGPWKEILLKSCKCRYDEDLLNPQGVPVQREEHNKLDCSWFEFIKIGMFISEDKLDLTHFCYC